MDERVEDTRHSSFRSVPRISIESLDENNVHRILDGQQPVIVEGMDTNWPPSYRNAALEDIVVFRGKTSSVHIDGVQRFDVSTKEILDLLHAGKNCRVFGAKLKPEMDNAFAQPHWLFDHLHLFRYSKTRRPEYFLGSGGAVTPPTQWVTLISRSSFPTGGESGPTREDDIKGSIIVALLIVCLCHGRFASSSSRSVRPAGQRRHPVARGMGIQPKRHVNWLADIDYHNAKPGVMWNRPATKAWSRCPSPRWCLR